MIGSEWEPHQLYRLFDKAGRLLYVGITWDLRIRLRAHRRRAPWWPAVATGTSEQHPDWFRAGSAERATIAEEHPIHNRSRALRTTDRSAQSALSVPMPSGTRALPQMLLDLRGYLSVPDSAQQSDTSGTSKTRAGARGDGFTDFPKNGHCGHCPACRPPAGGTR